MTLYLGMNRELVIVDLEHPENAITALSGHSIAALAIDPHLPDRLWCGTYGDGLLMSDARGQTWAQPTDVPESLRSGNVLSVAVSAVDDVVFAGTEPSRLFRSDDGGARWRELESLQEIPSKSTWSFPPKPETHHVRWITPHPTTASELVVAIEAGALVQSRDGGATWQDRQPGSPYDSHTVRIHPETPDRIRSAAGDGYFESNDNGETWQKWEDGLRWTYCWGLAIDAEDPEIALMSVAPNAGRGHGHRGNPQSAIYRRQGTGPWQQVSAGLPANDGTTLSVLAANPSISGCFYALNNRGLYASTNTGITWQQLDIPWKDEYTRHRPAALAVSRS